MNESIASYNLYYGELDMLLEQFEVHDKLNPLIWDGTKLNDDVQDRIDMIVAEFKKFIELPIDILDVQIVGSNASYNYTEHSDLDVHLIVNMEDIEVQEDILKALYDLKKSQFNSLYDIKIRGIDVEVYVQDVRSTVMSNGIYSLYENKWIKFPKKIEDIKQYDITKEVQKWKENIDYIIGTDDLDKIKNTIDRLYMMRKNSISVDGEYSKGNQIFKQLRNDGYLEMLKDAKNSSMSRFLSLENYTKGQLVNRFD